jgi:hypothetical protein
MKQFVLTTIAAACLGAAPAAQAPSGASQTPASTPAGAAASSSQKTSAVLTGCVYREKDVPGRAPNVAERAGVLEDYILAEVKPAQSPGSGSSATSGATGTSGTTAAPAGTMYKLEKIADERLKAAVGKRVEVTGRIDAEASDAAGSSGGAPATTKTDRAIGRDRVNLPEFEVASMREVSGSCPATPSGAVQR